MERLNKLQIDQLKFYQENAEENLIEDMMTIFTQQREPLIAKMRDLHGQGLLNQVSEVAHKLKSSSGQLGFNKVESLCLKIETEGRRKNHFDFHQAFNDLETESLLALQELKDYLQQERPWPMAS